MGSSTTRNGGIGTKISDARLLLSVYLRSSIEVDISLIMSV